MIEKKNIPISKIEPNTGQIDGLPKNPRFIKDEKFKSLVKSIKDHPEMLDMRELLVFPVNGKFVVIAGNMRLRAMKEIGYKEAPCKVIDSGTPVERLRAYAIKDNVPFGDNDWDSLANEWDSQELSDWGIGMPDLIDYSTKNKEINPDDLEEKISITLQYTFDEYEKVMDGLGRISASPEQAVWILLKLTNE